MRSVILLVFVLVTVGVVAGGWRTEYGSGNEALIRVPMTGQVDGNEELIPREQDEKQGVGICPSGRALRDPIAEVCVQVIRQTTPGER